MSDSIQSTSPPTFRIRRCVYVENIPNKIEHHKNFKSEKFFCLSDARPTVFHLRIRFEGDSLKVYLIAPDRQTVVTYMKVSLLDENGKAIIERSCSNRITIFHQDGMGWNNLLKLSDCADYESLMIAYEFVYEGVPPRGAISASPKLRFQDEFSKLLQSGDQADITFLVDGEKIPAHKVILKTRCEYFRSMFESGMSESASKEIEVTDIQPKVFKYLLEFIYTNVAPKYDKEVTTELLAAADKYFILDLKDMCGSHLSTQLNVDNVIDALLLADKHNCASLMRNAMFVFGNHVKALKTKECWQKLKENSSLLLRLLEHFCD